MELKQSRPYAPGWHLRPTVPTRMVYKNSFRFMCVLFVYSVWYVYGVLPSSDSTVYLCILFVFISRLCV